MKFEGIMPALITPLDENGKVNEKATRELVEYQLGQGAYGFYILGSTGEGLLLTEEERMKMCEIVVSQVNKRKPVICHIAAMNFEEAKRLCAHAKSCGADALSAIPPIFFKYSQDDIFNYYKTLAEVTDLPFIMYNHPSANGGMDAETVANMYNEIDNITGVKWTVNNYYQVLRLKDMTHGEMNIINGPDEMLVSGLAAGADAGIGTTYNVMLPQYIEIYKNFKAGNIEKAHEIQKQVNRVVTCIIKHRTIPATKQMCKMLGFDAGQAVYPQKQFGDAEIDALKKDLDEIGWPFN